MPRTEELLVNETGIAPPLQSFCPGIRCSAFRCDVHPQIECMHRLSQKACISSSAHTIKQLRQQQQQRPPSPKSKVEMYNHEWRLA